MSVFDLQNAKTRAFSRYVLEILYTYTPDRELSHIHISKPNGFYPLKCLRDRVSRKPLFLPKTGKT